MLTEILASPVFMTVALAVAGAVGTLLASAVVRFWTIIRLRLFHQLTATDMAFVDSIASKAVRYAFQVVESPEGQDRFAAAADVLAKQAETRGIPLTPAQIRLYIEAAYVDFKLTVSSAPVGPVATPATFPAPAPELGPIAAGTGA